MFFREEGQRDIYTSPDRISMRLEKVELRDVLWRVYLVRNYKEDLFNLYLTLNGISKRKVAYKVQQYIIAVQSIYYVSFKEIYRCRVRSQFNTDLCNLPIQLILGERPKKQMEKFLDVFQTESPMFDDIILYIRESGCSCKEFPIKDQRVKGKKFKYWNLEEDLSKVYLDFQTNWLQDEFIHNTTVIPTDVLERYTMNYVDNLHLKHPDIADYLRNSNVPEHWLARVIYGLSLRSMSACSALSLQNLQIQDLLTDAATAVIYQVPVAGNSVGALIGKKVSGGDIIDSFKRVSDSSRILDISGEVTKYMHSEQDMSPDEKEQLVKDRIDDIGSCYQSFFQKNAFTFLVLWLETNFNPFQSNDVIEDGYTDIDYEKELQVIFKGHGITNFSKTVDDIVACVPKAIAVRESNRYRLAYKYANMYFGG